MKKTIAIIMCLMLVVGLFAGCTKAPATTEEPATEAAAEAPAAEEATEAPAASGDKVINIYTFTEEVPKMV